VSAVAADALFDAIADGAARESPLWAGALLAPQAREPVPVFSPLLPEPRFALGIETIYCGGDLVGYGPHPNEVCALIAERAIPTIYGNYDYAIGRDLEDCGCAYPTQHERELGQRSVDWTLAHAEQHAKDFMRELPFDLRFDVGQTSVHLVHGSPRKVNEYLFEDKPASLYERLAAAEEADVLIFGHTHRPWVHEYGGVLFVNCGSVGKPKDGDPRGAFAILRQAGGELDFDSSGLPFDDTEIRIVGPSSGSVTCRNVFHFDAPSIAAASWSSWGICCRPAR